MNKYEVIRDILENSSYTVAMCGTEMMKESGMPSLRAPEIAYRVEKEYGYSPEEIFASVFYTNRKETFFKYYREEMLKPPLDPRHLRARPIPEPAMMPPMRLAVRVSSTRGTAGMGITVKKNVWLNTQTRVRKKNPLLMER